MKNFEKETLLLSTMLSIVNLAMIILMVFHVPVGAVTVATMFTLLSMMQLFLGISRREIVLILLSFGWMYLGQQVPIIFGLT